MSVLEIYKTSLTDEGFNYFYLTSSHSKVEGYMTILKSQDNLWDTKMLNIKACCRVTIISCKWVHLLASRITMSSIFILRAEAGRCTVFVRTNQLWDESKFMLSHWALQWNGWNVNTHSLLMTSLGGGRVNNSNNQLHSVNFSSVYWQKSVMQKSCNLFSDQ